jgi:hypothetical protein
VIIKNVPNVPKLGVWFENKPSGNPDEDVIMKSSQWLTKLDDDRQRKWYFLFSRMSRVAGRVHCKPALRASAADPNVSGIR